MKHFLKKHSVHVTVTVGLFAYETVNTLFPEAHLVALAVGVATNMVWVWFGDFHVAE